jgi:integrase
MYFDARAAKLLKPGNHIVVDGCPGLRLTATDTRKTWGYRFKSPVTGQMKQVKIGAWPEMPVAAAAEKWQELRAKRDAGEAVLAKPKVQAPAAADSGYTLGQMVRDYSTGYLDKRREPKGAKAVSQRLHKSLSEHLEMPAASVGRRFVFDLIDGLSDRPVLAASVKAEMGAAWSYALDAGRIDDDLPNWWVLVLARKLRSKGAVRDGKHKGTAKRTLTDAEIGTLMRVDLARFSQQVQDFLTIQLWTCTRGAEIVQMRKENITTEPDGVWWTIPKAMTKGAHHASATDLRVPLIGRALAVVQRLQSKPGWLFPSVSRTGVAGHQVQAYMQSKVHYLQPYSKSRADHVRNRLTVTHWSPHDLRRTGRTLLASMGCPNEVGEAILGHVQPGVVGTYNLYAYDKERLQWLTALSAQLESSIHTGLPARP